MTEPLRLGTRGSLLARTQSEGVANAIRALGASVELVIVTTRGDRSGLAAAEGGDGIFVRELQAGILDGRIDLAVHSLKDLPTAPVAGLELACIPPRENPFDALVGRSAARLEDLPEAAVVGSSSVRRAAQVQRVRPDLRVEAIRGNVDTRLRRLDAGDFDAIILAAAGLSRLGLAHRITSILSPDRFWPAVGQGALAVEVRADDARLHDILRPLDDAVTRAGVTAERACLAGLAGGCLAPVAAWGRVEQGRVLLDCSVFERTASGVESLHVSVAAEEPFADLAASAVELGRRAARDLEGRGALDMIARERERAGEAGTGA
jgi:hydroxymethylbilane synthase